LIEVTTLISAMANVILVKLITAPAVMMLLRPMKPSESFDW
jgi:hypothetical protein